MGLDTYKETIHETAIDINGEETLMEFLKDFSIWNTGIAIEACNIWRGAIRYLRKEVIK